MTESDANARPETQDYMLSSATLCCSSLNLSLDISSTELQRVLKSLLDQVDWLEVAVKVAKNWALSVYCSAIEKILLTHIYHLAKAEDKLDEASQFENIDGNEEHIYEGDYEDEDSEFLRESVDDDRDYEKDNYWDEVMEEDEDNYSDEDKDDEMDKDEEDGKSEFNCL